MRGRKGQQIDKGEEGNVLGRLVRGKGIDMCFGTPTLKFPFASCRAWTDTRPPTVPFHGSGSNLCYNIRHTHIHI
jgi:hypothetical protein